VAYIFGDTTHMQNMPPPMKWVFEGTPYVSRFLLFVEISITSSKSIWDIFKLWGNGGNKYFLKTNNSL